MTHIRKITPQDIKAMAREAAEIHKPLEEANDYCRGSLNWMAFNLAYREREAEIRLQRQVEEVVA